MCANVAFYPLSAVDCPKESAPIEAHSFCAKLVEYGIKVIDDNKYIYTFGFRMEGAERPYLRRVSMRSEIEHGEAVLKFFNKMVDVEVDGDTIKMIAHGWS